MQEFYLIFLLLHFFKLLFGEHVFIVLVDQEQVSVKGPELVGVVPVGIRPLVDLKGIPEYIRAKQRSDFDTFLY